jgi:hypothetical protein
VADTYDQPEYMKICNQLADATEEGSALIR